MMPLFQIPRNSLVWLLVAQAMLVLPHLQRLPVWIFFAWLITVVWRIQVFRGEWDFPNRWIKILLVVLCITGLLSEYGRFFGLEPMVGLLVSAFLLKLLEMRQKRDALIVVFLGYFVAATQFLFSQTLLTTLYMILTVITLTTALLGIHQSAGHRNPWRSFTLAGTLVGQSVPLMVVLFLLMPRIGSLWAVPQPENSARTGVSDSMSPGDFSQLVQNKATAFRVTFDGETPPAPLLYWRGLVLSRFDGRRWSQTTFDGFRSDAVTWNGQPAPTWRAAVETSGDALRYDVIMEASQQHWLYALPVARSADREIGFTRDYRLVSRQPLRQRYQYRVESHLDYRLAPVQLKPSIRRQELSLPEGFNPLSLQRAGQWRAEAGSDRAYIERVLRYFGNEFTYTLQPPVLGRNSVDEFLWQSKRGFCEHFASAFTVMMRAADIPARVVVGYQGGHLNPLKNFLVVRQADAHAWAEVWLPGEGWTRVDPTAAVAPQRIEAGLDSALDAAEMDLLDDPFSLESYSRLPLLNQVRLRLEVLEYDWHRWIMNYDEEHQRGLLQDLLGAVTPWRVAALLLAGGALALLLVIVGFLLRGGRRVRDPGEKLYGRFLRILKSRGIHRRRGEGPRSLARRAAREQPELKSWAARITVYYERYRYGEQNDSLEVLRKLLRSRP